MESPKHNWLAGFYEFKIGNTPIFWYNSNMRETNPIPSFFGEAPRTPHEGRDKRAKPRSKKAKHAEATLAPGESSPRPGYEPGIKPVDREDPLYEDPTH